MLSIWKFQALRLGHAFVWLWLAFDETGGIARKSGQLFPSYDAEMSDATYHGYDLADHGWEFVNTIDAPLGRSGQDNGSESR
jgi:hypothetical protein